MENNTSLKSQWTAKIFFLHNNGTSEPWFSLVCCVHVCVFESERERERIRGEWGWKIELKCFWTSTDSKAPGSSHHGFHLHGKMSSTTTCLAHTLTLMTFDQYSSLTFRTQKISWSKLFKRIQSPSVTWSLNMVYLSENQKSVKVVTPTGTRNKSLTISLTQSCDVVFLSEQQWASSGLQCCPQSWRAQVKALQHWWTYTACTENWIRNLLWIFGGVFWPTTLQNLVQRLKPNWIWSWSSVELNTVVRGKKQNLWG